MAALSILAPIKSLIICALIFISIDFITGIIASYKKAKRSGTYWGFESKKAWATVHKLGFVMAGIVLAWLIDFYILDFMNLRLANIFTGFVCGVEFWSYLENAADISNSPMFRKFGKLIKKKLDKEINSDLE